MSYTYDENLVSDLYKDARGYRPDEFFWAEWNDEDYDGRQAIWDRLNETLVDEIVRDRKAKCEAEGRFGDMITANMRLGAPDKIVAIRWILESESFSNYDLAYGPEYVSYRFGMMYDTMWKVDIQSAIDSMDIDFERLYEDDAA